MTSTIPKSAEGLFLRLDKGASNAQARNIIVANGLARGTFSISAVNPNGLFYVTPKKSLPLSQAWQVARDLNTDEMVLYAEVDVLVPGIEIPEPTTQDGRRYSSGGVKHKAGTEHPEWSLDNANVKGAWKLKPKGKGYGAHIRVGHPDTGYQLHPEIHDTARLKAELGYDYKSDKSDPIDPLKPPNYGHGTATASVIMSAIGSPDGDDKFVSGAAPKAELVPFRVSSSVIHFSFGNVVKAIYGSIKQKCHVISMSLGGPFGSKALSEAIKDAQDAGVIVLSAAGNKYKNVVYPAKIKTVIAVAASNCDDKPWKDTARGKAVDISAPGESVWRARTNKKGKFDVERSSGTSYAVALLGGICALWLSHHGRANLVKKYGKENLNAVFQKIVRTRGFREPQGWDSGKFGPGIVDAKKVLQAPLPKMAPAYRFAEAFTAAYNLNTIEELAGYFPEVSAGRLTEVLQKSLDAPRDDFFQILGEYGDELRFHCATNEEFRKSLVSQASSKRKSIRGFRGPRVIKNTQLKSQASKSLLSLMNAR
jgi:serine protease